MIREPRNIRREDVFWELGLVDVYEDVLSTDRLQDPELQLRDKGTRNIIICFLEYLEALAGVEGSGWSKERIEKVKEDTIREISMYLPGIYYRDLSF
jgi:hypothetical protein